MSSQGNGENGKQAQMQINLGDPMQLSQICMSQAIGLNEAEMKGETPTMEALAQALKISLFGQASILHALGVSKATADNIRAQREVQAMARNIRSKLVKP